MYVNREFIVGQFLSNLVQVVFRGLKEFCTFPLSVGGQRGIETRHESLTRKRYGGDLGQVGRLKKRCWDVVLVGELTDRLKTQSRNPPQPRVLLEGINLRLGERAPVAYEHDLLQAKARAELVNLLWDRRGVTGIARIDLKCNGASVGSRHDTVDNTGFAALLIPVIAEASQRTGRSLIITAGDVVQDMGSRGEMALGQFVFDPGLSGQQPVQGIVQVIFVGVAHTEFVSQGGAVPQAGGGEFRTGMEELFGHHGHDQIALLAGFGSNEGVKAKTAHSAQDRLDGAMGKRLLDREHAVRRHQRLVLQEASEGVDLMIGPMGEIGEGAFAYLGALAPSLP